MMMPCTGRRVDPKCANHLMPAARYALTTLAQAASMYNPERENRKQIEVSVTRRRLTENQSH
jgi:hypothetical protein